MKLINKLYLFTNCIIANGCPMPPKPDYGYVEPRGIQRIAVNDPAIYVCEEGYELRGQSQRICQNDGNYATDAPTCVSK